MEQEVTGDKETLIKKYQSDISTYELDLQNMEEKINDLNDLITKYSDKNKRALNITTAHKVTRAMTQVTTS